MRLMIFALVCALVASAASADNHAGAADVDRENVIESARVYVPAKFLETPAPRYPLRALHSGREAWIQLSYCIDESGVPRNIVVLDSTGDDAFESAAISSAEKWRFEPALADGAPAWQSGNTTIVTFKIEENPKSASRSFARGYRKLARLIDDGALDEADALFKEMIASEQLSLYEISKLWAQRARYELAVGDLRKVDVALHRATASGGEWIEEQSYLPLLAMRVRVEAELGSFTAAVSAYEALVERAGDDSPHTKALAPLIEEIHAILRSDAVIVTSAIIGRKGECHGCDDSYRFRLGRRQFAFQDIDGTLTTIDLRCDHKRFTSDISDSVEWRIPEAWGECAVNIYGEPGTTFSILAYPDT